MFRICLSWMAALAVLAIGLFPTAIQAEDPHGEISLDFFDRLVGGHWVMGDAYQSYEWGVGRLSLRGQSYRVVDGDSQLVGEGMLFHHAGDDALRGIFTATGMGIDLFDYTVKSMDENRVVFSLRTFGQLTGEFEEIWEFVDDDHFDWSLHQLTADGSVEMMSGRFERRAP